MLMILILIINSTFENVFLKLNPLHLVKERSSLDAQMVGFKKVQLKQN